VATILMLGINDYYT